MDENGRLQKKRKVLGSSLITFLTYPYRVHKRERRRVGREPWERA